jgi:phosphate transport system protein
MEHTHTHKAYEPKMEHTNKRYEDELSTLSTKLTHMGQIVVAQLESALRSFAEHDIGAARVIIEHDNAVNRMDIEVEELCLQLLALHQPAARDLRLIATAMMTATELERLGDRVVNVCEEVTERDADDSIPADDEVLQMGALAVAMVRAGIEAFSKTDRFAVARVMEMDKEFDALYSEAFPRIVTSLAKDPERIARDTKLAFLAKDLNEISEHATNIAEMVMFMLDGKEITHMDMHERRTNKIGA